MSKPGFLTRLFCAIHIMKPITLMNLLINKPVSFFYSKNFHFVIRKKQITIYLI
jgi:hypothetical protein